MYPQDNDLPMNIYLEAVYNSNYFLNQILEKEVGQVTPIEKWSRKKPSIGYLKTFGCVAWDHIANDF